MQEEERFVRDLMWAVNSPPLMDATHRAAQSLQASDIDVEHLRDHFTRHRDRRVGRYFERLLAYWVRYIRRCEVVAHSLQLRDGKRTLGEIDLLFRDEQGRLNHWEVACKFYLQLDVEDGPTRYIGPNPNDSLQTKASRLLEHQLPLGLRHFPEIELQTAFVKGRIFYHWLGDSKGRAPNELTTDHLKGKWLWARELPELLGTNPLHYRILNKPFWLSDEVIDPSGDELLSPGEASRVLGNHFRDRATPILISGFQDGLSLERECERWFVVPNQWPLEINQT